jgi:hypothetical protein
MIESYAEAKQAGPHILKALVNSANCQVLFSNFDDLERTLQGLGFANVGSEPWGPTGGQQVFFKNGILMARIKTKGDKAGPRGGIPHMSISITDGKGDKWFNDLAKFNALGHVAAKAFTSADRLKLVDHDGNPQRFVMIQGGLARNQLESVFDDWGTRTHFTIPAP